MLGLYGAYTLIERSPHAARLLERGCPGRARRRVIGMLIEVLVLRRIYSAELFPVAGDPSPSCW